jgi:hypothetical protein
MKRPASAGFFMAVDQVLLSSGFRSGTERFKGDEFYGHTLRE